LRSVLQANPNLSNIDLDDLFNDIYYQELEPMSVASMPITGGATAGAAATLNPHPNKRKVVDDLNDMDGDGDLTEQQKLERRERNREHAKRSRLRKKFLLESLQEQIHGLEEQLDGLKSALKSEVPDKAEQIIAKVCGDKEKYVPLPMPSGFGPVKTLMEPDFRLMTALSGSQQVRQARFEIIVSVLETKLCFLLIFQLISSCCYQNFAISDPTLPDNPIVYVSQGFLDLTGYTLDQVLGRNCRFLQGPGTDQSAVEVIRKGVTEGVDTSVCLLNYKADGTPFWNQFFVAALRDANNNIVNFVGVQCEVSKAVVEKHMGEQKK
jgi:PAS domain S-box-containing protein